MDVLDRLTDRFGPRALAVVDHWEGDLCAIGVARVDETRCLVYLCTHGRLPGRYDVELELPSAEGSDLPYTTAGWHQNIDFESLVALIGTHLGVSSGAAA